MQIVLLMLLVLFHPSGPTAVATPADPDLARIRQMYLQAVSEPSAIDRAVREIQRVRAAHRVHGGSALDATLTGYTGALITLRAKHGVWPATRLRHVREGLKILDDVVAEHPRNAEVRYLRLMSCYYLPSIFGRTASVREDFAALSQLLPEVREEYPPEAYVAIVDFVLTHGSPTPEQRGKLERALARAR
jgi:hypothetical protein